MVDDEDESERAKEQANENFEELSVNNVESTREYIARSKSLYINVQYPWY